MKKRIIVFLGFVMMLMLLPATAMAALNQDAAPDELPTARTISSQAVDQVSPGTVTGQALKGVTIRLRPQGSYSSVAVKDDGTTGQNTLHLYHIGGSGRFYLDAMSDDTYRMYMYSSFEDTDHKSSGNCLVDISSSSSYHKEGGAVHVVSGNENAQNKQWKFIRQSDGSYYIQNAKSGMYMSLDDTGEIDKDENKVVQRSSAMKWEIEVVSRSGSSNSWNTVKAYDSYNFTPDTATYGNVVVSGMDWMSWLPNDRLLSELSIPGTHDASTCSVSKGAMARCQQLYIDEQLKNGVRYLDLRISKNSSSEDDDDLVMRHGSAWCHDGDSETNLKLNKVMGWIESFLSEQPDETVIIQLKDNDDDGKDTKQIYNYYKNDVNNHPDRYYIGDHVPTLGEARGKIVIISRLDPSLTGSVSNCFDITQDGKTMQWALDAHNWQLGENNTTALAAGGDSSDNYEVWTQDNYNMYPSSKWNWIEGSLTGSTGPSYRRDQANSVGRDAWVISYTSCVVNSNIGIYYPQTCARDINKWLKQEKDNWMGNYNFLGAVCSDYTDQQLTHMVYRNNFRAEAAVAEVPQAKDLTYNGSTQELVTAGAASNGTMQYALGSDDSTEPADGWSANIPTGTDAKTYYVWYKATSIDRADSKSSCVTATIAQKPVIVTGIAAKDKEYDGKTNAELDCTSATFNGKAENDTLTCTAKGEFTSANAGAAVTVNISDITLGGTNANNYTVDTEHSQKTATAAINPTAAAYTTKPKSVAEELRDNGERQELITPGETDDGTILYAVARLQSLTQQELDNLHEPAQGSTFYHEGTPTGTDAGTYVIWYYIEGDSNHQNSTTAYLVKTIQPSDPSAEDITLLPSAKTDLMYSGADQELMNIPIMGVAGAEFQFFSQYGNDKLPNDATFSNSKPLGTAAGTYYVWFTIDDPGGLNFPTMGPFAVTIATAPLTVTAKNNTIIYGDVPTGNGARYSGFASGEGENVLSGELVYDFNYEQYDDVGSGYTITPSGLSSSNYKLTFEDGALTVEPKEVELSWGETKFTYNGSPQAPTATATNTVNGDEIEVTVNAKGDHIDASNTPYTAMTTSLTGDKKNNYKLPTEGLTAEFTIGKADARSLEDVSVVQSWALSDVNASVAGLMPSDSGKQKYSTGEVSKPAHVTVSDFSVDNAGIVKAKITGGKKDDTITLPVAIESTNYKDSTANVKVMFTTSTSIVVVNNGTGSGAYSEDVIVTISANDQGEGKQFKGWTGVDGLTFTSGSATSPTASFIMPARDVEATATYVGVEKMHRLYNPNSGEHLYTADNLEFTYLVSIGWNDEQYGWTAPNYGAPVFRMYNPNAGEHHYTLDPNERDMLVEAGWNYESVGWFSDSNKTVPLYREYNPNAFANNHNYTTDKTEHDYLISIGWHDEGIAWYGV